MKYLKTFEFYGAAPDSPMEGDYVIVDKKGTTLGDVLRDSTDFDKKTKAKIRNFCEQPGRIKSFFKDWVDVYWSNIPEDIQEFFEMDDDGYGGSNLFPQSDILSYSRSKKGLLV
jgi:hypothetical protein